MNRNSDGGPKSMLPVLSRTTERPMEKPEQAKLKRIPYACCFSMSQHGAGSIHARGLWLGQRNMFCVPRGTLGRYLAVIKSMCHLLLSVGFHKSGLQPFQSVAYMVNRYPVCRRLFMQAALRPDSFALLKAGRSSAARMAMMAMTTRSSMRVKAEERR